MQLHYHRYSDAGPVLVLMHGLFGSWDNLGGIARLLAKDFQVFSLDMRNHGDSFHSDQMTLADLAADVIAFLEQQQLFDVHLLGHSLGGKTMMEVALTAPERINKLVVADIAPVDYRVARHDDVFAGMAAVDLAGIRSRGQADAQMAQHVSIPAVRSFLLKNLVRDTDGGYRWRVNIDSIKRNYFELIGANRSDTQFTHPVLFIKGELSDYLQKHHTPEVVSRFPKASVQIIAGTGHWLHAEKPNQFAQITRDFLLADGP